MNTKSESLISDLLRRSLLYRQQEAELAEILRHKWLESEKAGHDVGLDQAAIDWKLKHRSRWLRERNEGALFFTFQI